MIDKKQWSNIFNAMLIAEEKKLESKNTKGTEKKVKQNNGKVGNANTSGNTQLF